MNTQRPRLNNVRLRKVLRERLGGEQRSVPHALRYQPTPHEDYTFENGRICINGMEVLSLIDPPGADVELLACLGGAIEEYRRAVWDRYGTGYKDFNAQTQGILEKILNRMNRFYEEVYGGLRVSLYGGRLWINDIDPKVVLGMFLSSPTPEKRRYLVSLFAKIGLILEGKAGKSLSHGVLEAARRLYLQMAKVLENTASPDTTPLLSVGLPLGR